MALFQTSFANRLLQKLTTCKEELAKAQEATLKQAETIAKLEAELEERQSVVDRAAEVEEKRAGRLATVKKLQAQLGKEGKLKDKIVTCNVYSLHLCKLGVHHHSVIII